MSGQARRRWFWVMLTAHIEWVELTRGGQAAFFDAVRGSVVIDRPLSSGPSHFLYRLVPHETLLKVGSTPCGCLVPLSADSAQSAG